MGRKIPLGLIAGLAALAIPAGMLLNRTLAPSASGADHNGTAKIERHQVEQQRKLQILETDISMTAELQREMFQRHLLKFAAEMTVNPSEPTAVKGWLDEKKQSHPEFHSLAWVDKDTIVQSGTIDDQIPEAKKQWNRAIRSLRQGKPYRSSAMKGDYGEIYTVLGVLHKEGAKGVALVGLIHQDLIRKVENHQLRNLRLQEFPNEDKRFGIRAMDPKTGREVDVDSAEENEGISHYRKKEVVVRFRTPPDQTTLEQMKKQIGATEVRRLGYAYVFQSNSKSTQELLDYFSEQDIVYAEPHYLYVTNETPAAGEHVPNDELYDRYQWNLPMIETETGWTFSKGSEDVIVAVIDTGVAHGHPDLQGHLTEGYNVVNPDFPPEDDVGHGTHVAGVISALTDNGQGVAGITWYNNIMPIKVLDSTGMGSTYSVAEGIIWAADHGAKVINMSLGNYASAQFLHDAIRYAFDKDVVLIAATGNDNTNQPGYPAAYPEVLAVSATNQYKERASFSNFGDYIDVMAPGENIASTYLDGQYAALSGTSMASPHVAALAALIRSANPALTNTEVYDIIRNSSNDLGAYGKDEYFGFGQINVTRALQMAANAPVPEAASDDETYDGVQTTGSWLEQLLKSFFGGGR